ncbi:MAG: choice-of-anchor P family protein, partial [Gemmatimonadaceae bacterium]
MTSTISAVKVLDGRISADVLVAKAQAANDQGTVTLGDVGSQLTGLRVDGVSVDANAPPNTRIDIANVGTLWVRRVVRASTSIEVRMLELVVEVQNSYDLPIGSTIQIAVARAGVK